MAKVQKLRDSALPVVRLDGKRSLPSWRQVPVLMQVKSSPQPNSVTLRFTYYVPKVVHFVHRFRPKFCMPFSCLSCALKRIGCVVCSFSANVRLEVP
jgi:hypothetical protein